MTTDLYLDSDCAQRGGRIAITWPPPDVSRDLDELRQAVGDPQLTYAAYPYAGSLARHSPT